MSKPPLGYCTPPRVFAERRLGVPHEPPRGAIAAGSDSLKDLRARRAQDHACLAVYILKVYILKMTLLVPVEPVVQLYRTGTGTLSKQPLGWEFLPSPLVTLWL